VLAAGGILGEAWMSGVLAGSEDASEVDFRDCEAFVGTSAGSIVAAHLAAGERPRRPRGTQRGADRDFVHDATAPPPRGGPIGGLLRTAGRVGAVAGAPLAPIALAAGAPVGARARALALSRIPDQGRTLGSLRRDIGRLGSRFDGRLRVCTVDKGNGRRVVFGSPGAPDASVAEAVVASCSIPWVFEAIRIGDRRYLDGGAWSFTNLDVAPATRDAEVLCLNPSASLGLATSSLYGLARTAVGAAAELEALALRARGVRVRLLGPDPDAAQLMGTNFMDPRPAGAVHAAGYRQGLAAGRG
jgi:NTE family protein